MGKGDRESAEGNTNSSGGNVKKFNRLIARIAEREKGAFEEFCNLFGKFIFLAVKGVTDSKELIEEAVDDVLTKIWNTAAKLPSISNPYGWLYTVSVNCAKDRVKSGRVYEDIGDIPVEDGGIAAVENGESFAWLISGLDDTERQVVLLRIVEDMSFKEISSLFGRPLSSITSLYYRALNKIKEKLN